jgi:hypothetical protein
MIIKLSNMRLHQILPLYTVKRKPCHRARPTSSFCYMESWMVHMYSEGAKYGSCLQATVTVTVPQITWQHKKICHSWHARCTVSADASPPQRKQ